MEILLIDIGALAVFLGYMAIVYRNGVSREAPTRGSTLIGKVRERGPLALPSRSANAHRN
jgi:hypothetical protein